MKYRLIIAALCALSLHLILFRVNFGFLSKEIYVSPETNVIQISFSSAQTKNSEPEIQEKQIIKKETKQQEPSTQKKSGNKSKDLTSSVSIESVSVVQKTKSFRFANKPPSCPEIARKRGYQGTVMLRALVNRNGNVARISIKKSSGYLILDQTALEAVKHWKFEPGMDGSKYVDM